ncbi:MAG: TerC family protein [Candidatus Omnitrophica bacterium]|nr:TerC family protein [Candidatus Omnitrophota bacterium]
MWHEILVWGGFIIFILAMLSLDLFVFQRKAHEIGIRESLLLTAFWIALALLFNLGVYFVHGPRMGLEFLAGYLIEKSLSMDNIFVFLIIFSYFCVPAIMQAKVLFWGILGAIILRAIFVAAGLVLIHQFHWIIYLFGLFLIWTGIKMVTDKDKKIELEKNPVLRILRRWIPVTDNYEGAHFFVKRNGKLLATPLFLVLVVVETTDLIFAVDSIPAIFAVTLDPFIVYSSNIFAILGLRALYFALAGMMVRFSYLNYGLSAILVFVGIKMLFSEIYHMPIGIALGFIALSITVSILFSIRKPKS